MNKNEFLKELRKSIHMLEDDEQADIVNEYSQHIDMKVKEGMSEADAIADFGPFDQLVEEVLGAYHVKAPEKSPASDAQNLINGGKQMVGVAADVTKKGYSKLKDAAAGAVGKARDKAAEARAEKADRASGDSLSGVGAGVGTGIGTAALSGIARGTSNLWAKCVSAAKTCIRWCWNAFVVCIAFGALVGAVCALFGFGFCIVLMLQGYPLAGVTVALFGGTVALTFATLLLIRLIVLKRTSSEDARWADAPNGAGSFPTQPLSPAQDSPATMPLPHL